jgi:hypothetical protein
MIYESTVEAMPKTKCDEYGFEHAWEDITEQIIFLTDPPQYPPKRERCKNCGLIRQTVVTKIVKVSYDTNDLKK